MENNNQQLVFELRPRTMDGFIGNKGILDLLKANLERNSLPHLLMLSGVNGTGKSSLAEYLALSLTCEDRTDGVNPCCECDSCSRALKSNFNSLNIKSFDLAKSVEKRDIVDVVNEIFNFESVGDKTVYILDELQKLDFKQQSNFVIPFTKVPSDVYIIICVDNHNKVNPEIRNRVTELELDKPSQSDALEFFERTTKKLGIKVSTKATGKMYVKGCKSNARQIVTNLELFRAYGEMTEQSVRNLFKMSEESAEKLWEMICDKNIRTDQLVDKLEDICTKENIVNVYKRLQFISVNRLGEATTVLNSCELNTVEKGRIKDLVSSVGNNYGEFLAIIREPVEDEEQARINILRSKIALITKVYKEKEQVSINKTTPGTTSNFLSRYNS